LGGVSTRKPSLVPKEVKIGTPAGFSGKKSEIDNFLFEMRQYIDCVNLGDS
jgi:hypothetical protein